MFKYSPEGHVYNSSIRYLENDWDYEIVIFVIEIIGNKGCIWLFQSKILISITCNESRVL